MWIQEQWVDEPDSTIMFHTHAHTHTTSNNIGGFFVFCILNLLVDYVNGLLKRVLDCLRLIQLSRRYLFFKKSTVVEEGGEAVQNREVLRTFFDASKYPLQMGIEYEISQSNQGQYVPLAFALQFEVRCFQSTLTFCSCFQIKL